MNLEKNHKKREYSKKKLIKKNFFLIVTISIIFLLSSYVLAQNIIIKSNFIKDSNFYLSLGNFLIKQGYEEHGLTAYKKALELQPNNKILLNNLGIYYKEKNPILSEEYFLKALEIDPKYKTARNNLALLYNSLNQYDKASEQLKLLINEEPDNINYNYDLAINLANKYYYQTKDYNDLIESIEYFKIVYNKDKNFMHVLNNIKVLEEIKNHYN